MNNDDLRIKTLFNAPPHQQTKSKIASYVFMEQVVLGLAPWLLVNGLAITLGFMLGNWWWSVLAATLAMTVLGFLFVLGNSYHVTQYYLYARTGVNTQHILETLCIKDEGFEEFLVANIRELTNELTEGKK